MDEKLILDEFYALMEDQTLLDDVNLEQRAHALALIRLLRQLPHGQRSQPALTALLPQAAALEAQIEQVNQQLFQRIRHALAQGECRGERLNTLLRQFTAATSAEPTTLYFKPDGLDVLLTGALGLERGPTQHRSLAPGMVHYEPTPARAILALVARVKPAPPMVFYDLGSGLGGVPILVHLLTGVQTKGVEIEAEFCRFSQEKIIELNLRDVTVLHADARTVDYGDGDIFFMFTPFSGVILQEVLNRLHERARQRPLTLCTYGPCTLVAGQQPWLSLTAGNLLHEFALTIFSST